MKKVLFSASSFALCKRFTRISQTNNSNCLSPFNYIRTKFCHNIATADEGDRQITFKFNPKTILKEYPNAESLLKAIENTNFSPQLMSEIINYNPEVVSFDPSTVVSNISQLLHLGFEPKRIKQMAKKYPHLLTFLSQDITDTFETWRSAGLHELFLWDLFRTHPSLFSVSNNEVVMRIRRIKYLMVDKINREMSLLMKNPTIMYTDWNQVEEKFAYLYHTMRVLEKDISRSSALSFPLAHIKLRHTFLERCGEYIRPKKKDDTGFNPIKNPSLSAITDTSDETFALNVAKVSPDEFNVFKKLMNYEEKIESEEGYELNDETEFAAT